MIDQIAGNDSEYLNKAKENYESIVDITKLFQKGKLQASDAFHEIKQFLNTEEKDLFDSEDKLSSLNRALKKIKGLEDCIALQVKHGWSNEKNYWIVDQSTQEKEYFLKIFFADDPTYLREIFGIHHLGSINVVNSPKILALGEFKTSSKAYFWFLEDVVEGSSMQDYYHLVGIASIDKRDQALKDVYEGAYACGQGLGKLHNSLNSYQKLSGQAENDMRSALNKSIRELKISAQEGIDIEQLKQSVEICLEKMKRSRHWLSLTHGDMKLAHTFYDKETKTIALIDPPTLCRSLDENNFPQALASFEYYSYMRSLLLNRFEYSLDENQVVTRKEVLTLEEVKIAQNCFKIGYGEMGSVLIPNAIEEDFALLRHNLLFLSNINRKLACPAEQERLKDLLNVSLDDLRKRLKQDHD